MKNSAFIFLVLFFILISHSAFGQGQYKGNFQGTMPMDAQVIGTVVDAGTGQPVEYAVIAIRRMRDSSLVTGVSSKTNGSFTVDGLPYGKFYAEITFVGYKKQRVLNILLTPNQKTANIGTVKIGESSTDISAIVVTGNKPAIEYQIDKKVIDLTQNVVAAGGTVVDALQNIPSIQTDVEGNVTLRGSSNYTVLIDGKPSPLTGSEALQQIPASLVQNVEIITNPSAKYDAEGSAGIINVVMKKQNVKGMNGILNVTAGTHDKYSANLNVNYMISKFNFSLGGDFTDMKYFVTSYNQNIYTLPHDSIKNQFINGNGDFHRKGKGLKAGIDYKINDKNTISLSGNIGSRNFDRSFSSTYIDNYVNNLNLINDTVYYRGDNSGISSRTYNNLNLDYQLKLNDKGHKLSASLYYSNGPEDNISTSIQDTTTSKWMSLSKNRVNQSTSEDNTETEIRSNVDYSYPFSDKGKLEAGYQGRYNNTNGSYVFDTLVGINWIPISGQGDQIKFSDQIQSAYVTYSNSFVLFDYQLGIRADYENRVFNEMIQNKKFYYDTLIFYPTVNLSRQLPWDLQIQASFSRRIDRPREWNLNPVPMKVDQETERIGNPGLKPQFTDSYELNLEKKLNDASFFSMEGFYRRANNLIEQHINYPKPQFKILTTVNIDHDRSIGTEFMLNLALAKWFNFNSSLSLYNHKLFGTLDTASANSKNIWNLRINPTFRLKWGTSIQLNYIYNSSDITSQGTRSGFYSSSIGIKQDMFKRKGSLTLQIQNPFGRTRSGSTINSSSTYSYNWFQRESKVFLFTFSYRINNYKVQRTKQQQDDNSNAPDMDMNGGGM